MVSGGSDGSDKRRRITPLEALFCILAIFGTAVVIYAAGGALGVETGRKQVNARQHYDQVKNDALKSCIGREGSALRDCATEAVETAQDQSVSRQDLYAQQDMAKWAFWMMCLTFGTVLVTGVGVYFVKRTLDTNSDFLEESIKATGAMERQNNLAEQGQRPWVTIEIDVSRVSTKSIEPEFDFDIIFRNVGRSVATFFNFYHEILYEGDGRDSISEFVAAAKSEVPTSKILLVPGDSHKISLKRHTSENDAIWNKSDTENIEGALPLIMVAAHYKISPEQKHWNFAIKGFRVKDSRSKGGRIPRQPIRLDASYLITEPATGNIAN